MAWYTGSADRRPFHRPAPHTAALDHPVGRRAVLLGAAGLVLGAAGCSGNVTPPHPTSSAQPSTTGSQQSATATGHTASPGTASLPPATQWQPNGNDVDGDVKLRAVQLIEAIGTWPAGQAGAVRAAARVAALGLPSALVRQAGPLLPAADEAALQVIEAQYGGVLADSASVLVVCRQWTRHGSSVVTGGTTVDVRLSGGQPRWTVTALHPAQPGSAAPSLPGDARRVLSDPRIQFPPDAVADIRSGAVHESVLRAMSQLAAAHRMYVSVIRSGHPIDVFGTTRPSDHPRGRAFDVWQFDGHAVVDAGTPRSLIETFMREAAAAGSYNVGGPVLLSGATPDQFFSDDTHHDHVHIGFSS